LSNTPSLNTPLDGGSWWYKVESGINVGQVFQVGTGATAGEIEAFATPSCVTTTTTTTAIPTTTTTTTAGSTTTTTTTTSGPCIDCYVYEYINNSDPGITINVNGTLCAGGAYSQSVAPDGEGATFCIRELSQSTIDAYAAQGMILTRAIDSCGNSCG
jgi:hypothetical protein